MQPGNLRHPLGAQLRETKIWPFDPFAERTGGHAITAEELKQGLRPFQRVREAVGDRMEPMVELHSKWDPPCAVKIAHALEEYQPSWFEDPLRMNCLDALGDFAASTSVPVAASETIATARAFRELIEGVEQRPGGSCSCTGRSAS